MIGVGLSLSEVAVNGARADTGGGGGDLPDAPDGFSYVVDGGSNFVISDGAYVLVEN